MQERAEPASISTVVRDLEPGVERIIMRCLDPSPSGPSRQRARAVATGLDGNALAAALAAGETPSPELVAAAGESEGLRPKIAVAWLASALAMIAITGYLAASWSLTAKLPLEASPDALAQRCAHHVEELRLYPAKPVDTALRAFIFRQVHRILEAAIRRAAAVRWRNPAVGMPPLIHFWYRESPDYMTPQRGFGTVDLGERSAFRNLGHDLAAHRSGWQAVAVRGRHSAARGAGAPRGALRLGRALPRGWPRTSRASRPPTLKWTPHGSWDARAAWTGSDSPTGAKLRVEAASWRSLPGILPHSRSMVYARAHGRGRRQSAASGDPDDLWTVDRRMLDCVAQFP